MNRYFQLDEHIIHLNHAAVAPWPKATRDAVIAFARENASIGSQHYDAWMQTEQQLKHKLALLINARFSDEIAILKNTSEGLSLIAQGLDFSAGDNLVVPAEEFPSNKVVWQALESLGVEIRLISLQDENGQTSDDPEQALIDAIDKRTRLLSCSSVQFARGLCLDLNRIGRACKQNGTLFCVDAIQSLGAMSFDVQACHADFVVADGHKWMCGPEGAALFYCRQSVQPRLRLRQFGWHMLKDAFDFSDQQNEQPLNELIIEGAQRFECGSPNMLGITALDASLGVLLDIGIEKIQSAVLENSKYLIEQLQNIPGASLLTPIEAHRHAGIVTFSIDSADNLKLYQHLQNNNVICAFRGGGIRFSPHFYTSRQVMDRALAIVSDIEV
ncbi:MAG: aminotransferase class V-fold PLP-dependent enzyme [Gammaproteobacteria bacterium]|nr:aminotransferase class V-fold PLP-dependent enzyme [Gammaproteobacteria bacterium]